MGTADSMLPTHSPRATEEGAPAEAPAEEERPPGRVRRLVTSPAAVATATWLVFTPIALLVPRLINVNPMGERGGFIPLGLGGGFLVLLTAAAWRWRQAATLLAAGAAGLLAAWMALAFRVALYGTPHGVTGLQGDRVRVAAAAMRYTVTPWSADAFIEGYPSEYPPLFPWLVGRGSLLVDVPAWRLLTIAEVLVTSLAVLAAFLLWQRLVPAPVALVLSAVGLLVYGDPRKAFALITLLVFVPWLLATFAEPHRGRLHWLPAGIIGGLIALAYIGWFPFGVLGILAVIISAWRRSANQARYVRHVLLTGLVSAVVAAPYLVPWAAASLTKGGQAVGDMYTSYGLTVHSFPFFDPTLLGALQLVGLVGLFYYRRRTWWAAPMLYLVAGSYLFWLILGIRFIFTEHTALFYYAPLLTSATQLMAAVLVIVQAGPALARRFSISPPYRTGAAVSAVAILWVTFTYWQDWRPVPEPVPDNSNNFTTWAHLEPWPDCSYPKYAPEKGRFGCYPVERIKEEVERVRGAGARPRTLATDERLYAYLPWPGFMGIDRTSASTFARWDDRFAELKRLAATKDPAEFARASASTPFGPIDVFVLYQFDTTTWSAIYTKFDPDQFDPAVWAITTGLPNDTVVAVRRTA